MARIRSIKPDFWHSADVCALSRDARLLWIGLWNYADDAGRGDARPKAVKIHVFPADDDLNEEAIAGLMIELLEGGVGFELYEVGGRPYYHIPPESWDTKCGGHQRIDKPQPPKFPEPTKNIPRIFQEYSRNKNIGNFEPEGVDNTTENSNSKNTPGTLQEHSSLIGGEGIGEDRRGGNARAREAPPWELIVDMWCSVGKKVTGETVIVDASSLRQCAEKLHGMCIKVDKTTPLDVAEVVFTRYWEAKHAKGQDPQMRFMVEDFSAYLRGKAAAPRMDRDQIETKLAQLESVKRAAESELEGYRIHQDGTGTKKAESDIESYQKEISALRGQL